MGQRTASVTLMRSREPGPVRAADPAPCADRCWSGRARKTAPAPCSSRPTPVWASPTAGVRKLRQGQPGAAPSRARRPRPSPEPASGRWSRPDHRRGAPARPAVSLAPAPSLPAGQTAPAAPSPVALPSRQRAASRSGYPRRGGRPLSAPARQWLPQHCPVADHGQRWPPAA